MQLAPRARQVLDAGYLERFYTRPSPGGGPSWHELYLECAGNASLIPFQTRAAPIRALAGQTALFYSARHLVDTGLPNCVDAQVGCVQTCGRAWLRAVGLRVTCRACRRVMVMRMRRRPDASQRLACTPGRCESRVGQASCPHQEHV